MRCSITFGGTDLAVSSELLSRTSSLLLPLLISLSSRSLETKQPFGRGSENPNSSPQILRCSTERLPRILYRTLRGITTLKFGQLCIQRLWLLLVSSAFSLRNSLTAFRILSLAKFDETFTSCKQTYQGTDNSYLLIFNSKSGHRLLFPSTWQTAVLIMSFITSLNPQSVAWQPQENNWSNNDSEVRSVGYH